MVPTLVNLHSDDNTLLSHQVLLVRPIIVTKAARQDASMHGPCMTLCYRSPQRSNRFW